MIETISVPLDAETKKRLDSLAERSQRPAPALAAEAIIRYLDAEDWQLGEIEAGIADLDAGRAVSHDQAKAASLRWDRDDFESAVVAAEEGFADVEAGRSRPAADVLQDLRHKAKALALRQSIQEGLDSGASDRSVDEIWAEAEARFKSRNT